MTPTEKQRLRSIADGFRGRFFFDAEREDIAYIAKDCDDRECDCEVKTNSDGDQDCSVSLYDIDDVGEPIAAMLNAIPALLDENDSLRTRLASVEKLCGEACQIAEDWIGSDGPIPDGVDYRADKVRVAEIKIALSKKETL